MHESNPNPERSRPRGLSSADGVRVWPSQVGHLIQDVARDEHLGLLPSGSSGAKAIPDDRLVPKSTSIVVPGRTLRCTKASFVVAVARSAATVRRTVRAGTGPAIGSSNRRIRFAVNRGSSRSHCLIRSRHGSSVPGRGGDSRTGGVDRRMARRTVLTSRLQAPGNLLLRHALHQMQVADLSPLGHPDHLRVLLAPWTRRPVFALVDHRQGMRSILGLAARQSAPWRRRDACARRAAVRDRGTRPADVRRRPARTRRRGLVAADLPVRRASRVHPVTTLRTGCRRVRTRRPVVGCHRWSPSRGQERTSASGVDHKSGFPCPSTKRAPCSLQEAMGTDSPPHYAPNLERELTGRRRPRSDRLDSVTATRP